MDYKSFSYHEIMELPKFHRINLINSVSGFKSANLLGTTNENGVPNLAIFSSVVHIGSNPPYLGFILRPVSVPRHTYLNLKHSGFFTVNQVPEELLEAAHQTSASYPEGVSEFEACGLTPVYSSLHPAPYVMESKVRIGLEFAEEKPIEVNNTLLIVGRILEIQLPTEVLSEDYYVHHEKAGSLAIGGLDGYYRNSLITRKPYARP